MGAPAYDPGPAVTASPIPSGRVSLREMDPGELRNRLLIAANTWREVSDEPLPKMPAGDPEEQLRGFELKLVDLLCSQATPETARQVADRTWDLVHDRPDDDAVKKRVTECHEALARLSARGGDD
jgi:hypothetical protein